MRRLVWILPLFALVFLTATAAWSNQAALENSSWQDIDGKAAEQRSGYHTLQKEFEEAYKRVKSAVRTCVSTVITVAKVLLKAIITVVVSIAKVVVRFAFALVLVVVRWLLGLFLPV
jgi:hypothetical protein